jgi:hypothetical protein
VGMAVNYEKSVCTIESLAYSEVESLANLTVHFNRRELVLHKLKFTSHLGGDPLTRF